MRRFSFDGYREAVNSSGQRVQAHYTYKLLGGQPSYDSAKEEFTELAKGKGNPATSSTHPAAH